MKKILVSIITVIIIIGITGYIFVSDRLELAKERIYSPVHISRSDSTITIAVIGDSWAAYSKKYHFDKMIDNRLLHHGIKASTLISGMPGAKTSQIYCNMFDDSTEVGTKKIISSHPQYCILLMGINDLNGQYGPQYYTHHSMLVIRHLQSKNIIPIVYNIPEVNYLRLYDKYPIYKKTAYQMLSFITTGNTKLDKRDLYIEEMNHALSNEGGEYILSDVDFLKQDKETYLEDDIHLNEKGYIELSKSICDIILKQHNKKK